MQLKNVQTILNRFAKNVIKASRSNLTRQKKGGGNLYKSLSYVAKEMPNSSRVKWFIAPYGSFVDQGVKGAGSSINNRTSPFQFGTGTGKRGGLRDGILKWIQRKRFQWLDDETGRFMSYKSMAFFIARSIYQKGTKPSLFFTRPFEKAFANIDKEIQDTYALDLETFLPNNLKDKNIFE